MIHRRLSSLPLRMLLVGAVAMVAGLCLTIEGHRTAPTADATSFYGQYRPGTQPAVVIQGHAFVMPVTMWTCYPPYTNEYCRVGAYETVLSWDATKFSLATDGNGSTGPNTTTTFKDTSRTWKLNQWAGSTVTLLTGNVHGTFNIISNTANTLTVSPAFPAAPTAVTVYTLGGINDGGFLGSTGRSILCPVGPTYGSNWAELHCVSLGSDILGPTTPSTAPGVIVNVTMNSLPNTHSGTPYVFSLMGGSSNGTPPLSAILDVAANAIPADILTTTRRIILCPDAIHDGVITSADLGKTASLFGKHTGDTGFIIEADPDENGIITSADLGIIAAVFGQKCTQV